MKRSIAIASIAIGVFFFLLHMSHAQDQREAIIYYNEACRACAEHIENKVIPLLRSLGIKDIVKKDYIKNRKNRVELANLSSELGIPVELQGHFSIFIDRKIILQGHIPESIIRALVEKENEGIFERIVVYQDRMEEMGPKPEKYKAWAFLGEIREYPLAIPITEYLTWFEANKGRFQPIREISSWDLKTAFPIVLTTGLLDGINPCAFSVLLFFIAFLFTIHRTRADVLKVGSVYIGMIFITYLGIGLGILNAFVISGASHLMAKIGAGLLIALGLVNVKDYFWYGRWVTLSLPHVGRKVRERWMQKGTVPAAAVLGFLLGLCTFPCTGGIYVAVLGLLSLKTTYWAGFGYLLLYNFMFVMPLIILLGVISNRRTVAQITRWETSHKHSIKLISGLVMIGLGVLILIWFI